jgi:WD40 repeat protein
MMDDCGALDRRRWLHTLMRRSGGGLTALLLASAAPRSAWSGESSVMNWPSRVLASPNGRADERAPVITATRIRHGGQEFATAGDDHRIYLWRLIDGQLIRKLNGHQDWVQALAYSPNGEWLASAGNDRRILIWDVERGSLAQTLADPREAVTGLSWSPDGGQLVSVGLEDRLRIYNSKTWQVEQELVCPSSDIRCVDHSADQRWLAVAGRQGHVRLWDRTQNDRVQDYQPHRQRVRALGFAPDSDYLVSAGEDRKIHVISLAHSNAAFELPGSSAKILALTFYGSQELATGGSDNLIRLWDLAERRELGTLAGHRGSVASLTGNGAVLISSGFDTEVRIWTISAHVARERPPATRTSRKEGRDDGFRDGSRKSD